MWIPLCVAWMVFEAQDKGWAKKIYDECASDLVPGHEAIAVRLLYGDDSVAGTVHVDRELWAGHSDDERQELCKRLVQEMRTKHAMRMFS